MQAASFAATLRAAEAAMREGYRVLLYACDAQGRAALLPQARWAYFAKTPIGPE